MEEIRYNLFGENNDTVEFDLERYEKEEEAKKQTARNIVNQYKKVLYGKSIEKILFPERISLRWYMNYMTNLVYNELKY